MKLKVKAWFEEEKQMLSVRELYQSDENGVYGVQVVRNDEAGAEYWYTLAPGRFVLLQYTGLKDKNGREIFEGDVVKIVYADGFAVGSISMEDCWWSVNVKHNVSTFPDHSIPLSPGDDINILGNIYENPKLLHA